MAWGGHYPHYRQDQFSPGQSLPLLQVKPLLLGEVTALTTSRTNFDCESVPLLLVKPVFLFTVTVRPILLLTVSALINGAQFCF